MISLSMNAQAFSQHVLIEAESFEQKGNWVVDAQFVEQMGSPYLMAHGMGIPVEDAKTTVDIEDGGDYKVWARTINWAPGGWEAPGQFKIEVNDQPLPNTLGITPEWGWELAGEARLESGANTLALHDLTGFNGRCDAIYLTTTSETPPSDKDELARWRKKLSDEEDAPRESGTYDLVVVGGGIAGCAASIAAAEQGLKVALIHDRPVLGGNASSEIRVHSLGIYGHFERIIKMLDTEHYPNGSPEARKDQDRRHGNMNPYDNIALFLLWRTYDVITDSNAITCVDARHTSTGQRMRFEAPLFADCTGDGWIGCWAGAAFMYGRERADTYNEAWEAFGERWSPDRPDNAVMGSSVLWRTCEEDEAYEFPEVPWAMEVVDNFAARKGTWHWEYSRNNLHQVHDAEQIRDHMLKAIYGSFYNEKKKSGTENLRLEWVSYLVGKRESRRLVGDHIFTFDDVRALRQFPDSVVLEKRAVDVHYQQNLLDQSTPDFLSEAMFYNTPQYVIPYRSLYSANVKNLFMAGRCFSCSHVGLGGPRVMRTTGQMGAAVGFAAAICKKYEDVPRQVYTDHLDEYMELIHSQNEK